jgi:hypothetical protein
LREREVLAAFSMRYASLATVFTLGAVFALVSLGLALDGQVGIHDPSTVVMCNGKHYTYGTGSTSLVSDDGWTSSVSRGSGDSLSLRTL